MVIGYLSKISFYKIIKSQYLQAQLLYYGKGFAIELQTHTNT